MYLNQSLIGEVAAAQHADRLREASAARRAHRPGEDHASRHSQNVITRIRGWAGLTTGPQPQPYFMEEVETTIARCMGETPATPEAPAGLDEALVQQLLTGYLRPAPDPPPGTSAQAEWISDLQHNPYLRDAA